MCEVNSFSTQEEVTIQLLEAFVDGGRKMEVIDEVTRTSGQPCNLIRDIARELETTKLIKRKKQANGGAYYLLTTTESGSSRLRELHANRQVAQTTYQGLLEISLHANSVLRRKLHTTETAKALLAQRLVQERNVPPQAIHVISTGGRELLRTLDQIFGQ